MKGGTTAEEVLFPGYINWMKIINKLFMKVKLTP